MELKDLEKSDLAAAAEFFGVEYDKRANVETITKAFAEEGVTIKEVIKNNPSLKEKYEPAPVVETTPPVPNVVTKDVIEATDIRNPQDSARDYPEVVAEKETIISTLAQAKPADQFLVKMRRQNPLFETSGYRFTQDHPYAVVDAKDLNKVLSEEGFSIATPDEVTEYYS